MLLGKAWKTCGSDADLSIVSSLTLIAFSTDASISVRFSSTTIKYLKNLFTEKA